MNTNTKNKIIRMLICFISTAILVFLDRLTKIWATNRLKDNEPIWIIKKALQLYYLPNGNKGAAWGMFEGKQGLFVLIAVIVIIAIIYILYNIPTDKKYIFIEIMLVFIASGGIGNMYDRIVQGYVVDFIYFSLINFPIFNVADIYVSVCTILFAIYLIFVLKEDEFTVLEKAMKDPINKYFKKTK